MKVKKNNKHNNKNKTKIKLNSKEISFEKEKNKINPLHTRKFSATNRNLKRNSINPANIRKKRNEGKGNISEKNISFDYDPKLMQDEYMILRFRLFDQIKEKNWDKSICKLEVNKKTGTIYGTGFFCDIPSKEMKVLITNNHNIDSNVLNEKGLIKYFINNNGIEQEKYLNLRMDRFTYTEEKNDFTIIEIIDEDCIDYFIEIEENGVDENELKDQLAFSLQYPDGKDLSFSSGRIISFDNKNYENLTYNIGTKKGSSGSPIILLKNLKIVGIHKSGYRQFYSQIEKKSKGIPFKKILDKIPYKDCLNEDKMIDKMIKCEYNVTKENIGQMVQIYNNQNNVESKIKRLTIYEGSEEKEKIINGKYKFKKEGRYFIKYYFDETVSDLSSMFYNCPLLYKVNTFSFSKSNKIGDISKMFENCNYLKEIDLTKFNATNNIDMAFMFSQCNSLEKIKLPKFNTIKATKMESLFNECKNIREIDLSSFDTKNVTDMSYMFNQCNSLEKINLQKLNTNNVENMKYMFNSCNNLREIDLSSFDTKNVTDMSNMFNQCSSLENLDLSRLNTKNVTDMSNMFNQCSSLKKLDLSSFDTKNVTNMSNMFNQCSSLENLDLSRLDTKNVKNLSNMFNQCSSLKKLDLSSFDTKNVTNMSNLFNKCTSLNTLFLSSFNTKKVTDMSNMFCSCRNLNEIDLSSFDTKNVKNMSYMFRYCYSLKEIKFSLTFKANQSLISQIFYGCSSLKNINSQDEKIMEEFNNKGN